MRTLIARKQIAGVDRGNGDCSINARPGEQFECSDMLAKQLIEAGSARPVPGTFPDSGSDGSEAAPRGDDSVAVAAASDDPSPFDSMTREQLCEAADARGISYSSRTTKVDLVELLTALAGEVEADVESEG